MKTAIIDYGAGNVFSVATALERLGAQAVLTGDEKTIRSAPRVIFPGVGQASAAMEKLRASGLDEVIRSLTQPVLGVCLGMQMMCRRSEEGDTSGLDIFPMEVRRFDESGGEKAKLKVPHMGWNTIKELRTGLFEGLDEGAWMYFVHSYYVPSDDFAVARTEYGGVEFASALARDNFFGCQFHPEKSSRAGARILSNFLDRDFEKKIKGL